MFQPQPTPFATFFSQPYGLGDAFIPDARFHQSAVPPGAAALPQFLYASPQSQVASPPTASPALSSIAQFHQTSPPQPPPASIQASPAPSYDIPIKMEPQQPQQPQQSASASPTRRHQEPDLRHDLAAQEVAARSYQPQYEGPLVGEKESSHAIVQEYAKAHPVYVAKTAALPQTYSHYRRIQGDGNCGWRAMGFGYFECLIQSGDQGQIESEVVRMMSLNSFIANFSGWSLDLFEDMSDVTIQLLKDLAVFVPADPRAAMNLLMQRFNDRVTSSNIIYHLRLLASALFQRDPDAYVAFLNEDAGGPEGYCKNTLQIVDREIDGVGVSLLYEMLFKPLQFVLEISYLDTSPGTLANVHRWPDTAKDQDPVTLGPMVCLLFRPDHYDMLYHAPPPPAPIPVTVSQAPLQVNRAVPFVNDSNFMPITGLDTFATLDFNPLAFIPGFGEIRPMEMPSPEMPSPMYSLAPPPMPAPAPAPVPVTAPPPPMAMPFRPAPVSVQDPWVVPHAAFSPDGMPPHDSMLHGLAPRTMPPPPPPQQQPPPPQQPPTRIPTSLPPPPGGIPGTYPIRVTKEVWDLSHAVLPEPSFKNSIFKNTPFNRAHYNNPQFHPEQWTPADEFPDKPSSKRRKHRAAVDKTDHGIADTKVEVKTEPV